MNFTTAFFRTVFWRPIDAYAALFWWITGRKVRARNRLRMAAEQSPYAYSVWVDSVENQSDIIAAAPAIMAQWQHRPKFSVIFHQQQQQTTKDLARALTALGKQCYAEWELILVQSLNSQSLSNLPLSNMPLSNMVIITEKTDDPKRALQLASDTASGDYVLPLAADTTLPATALFRYAEALQNTPQPLIIYGDHDEIDLRGKRSKPWFKPRWNDELFLAQDYLSAACVLRADLFRRAIAKITSAPPARPAASGAEHYDLLLNATSDDAIQPDTDIAHIPHIQSHCRHVHGPNNQSARLATLSQHLACRHATVREGPFGTTSVAWPLPQNRPLVSIIVPTRDQVKLLRSCITSVLTGTHYHPFELIIVDNGSVEAETHAYLKQVGRNPAVRILQYDAPYNFSAINNFAVKHAQGSYICLLNNDTEVLDDQWLTEMMRQATRPEVGAVGAKLLYADGSIQHAGVVIGLGEAAGHAHRYLRGDKPGYFHRPHVTHYVSAVTAACLLVSKEKFDAVGGLDAEGLPIAFNDVDFCLKLERAGWQNIYTPLAKLVHHESKSRGKDISPEHINRYMGELAILQGRWGTINYNDPLHHPNLDRYHETYVIRL